MSRIVFKVWDRVKKKWCLHDESVFLLNISRYKKGEGINTIEVVPRITEDKEGNDMPDRYEIIQIKGEL